VVAFDRLRLPRDDGKEVHAYNAPTVRCR
jgi:hypothetical protein